MLTIAGVPDVCMVPQIGFPGLRVTKDLSVPCARDELSSGMTNSGIVAVGVLNEGLVSAPNRNREKSRVGAGIGVDIMRAPEDLLRPGGRSTPPSLLPRRCISPLSFSRSCSGHTSVDDNTVENRALLGRLGRLGAGRVYLSDSPPTEIWRRICVSEERPLILRFCIDDNPPEGGPRGDP